MTTLSKFIIILTAILLGYGGLTLVTGWINHGEIDRSAVIVLLATGVMLYFYVSGKRAEAKQLNRLTIKTVTGKMDEKGFDPKAARLIEGVLEEKRTVLGDKDFQAWLGELTYTVPGELADEEPALRLYHTNPDWVEREVSALERETKLSWEEQTEDLKHLDDQPRKAQLVVRTRLTEIIDELKDAKDY
ncbi:hypothetical protein JSY36_05795 [Bacillus sp. H-16]|uniref:hypothetical protein n=1 Tax=Alteribacter salitolerans TaxID=2912333 RepID=UPI0019652543|nr:hypothetical protein [Alteribacter salitolerans]MBM7095263.1 hypothetical protein [Alteribacter salitolerans]